MVESLPDDFSPSAIADIGCGNGNVTVLLAEAYPTAAFSLVDASPEMLEICKRRFAGLNGQFIECYFQDLDLATEQFDLMTAGFSLHHLPAAEKKMFFRKIHHWLKKGGIFSYSDLMIDKEGAAHASFLKEWQQFVSANYQDEEKWQWLMDHYHAFDHPNDFNAQISWLEEAGFSNVKVTWRTGPWVHLLVFK